jgi:hypothetical protein
LQRQIGRENTMFQTRNQAMGGSKTADNLNDDAAMAVSPEIDRRSQARRQRQFWRRGQGSDCGRQQRVDRQYRCGQARSGEHPLQNGKGNIPAGRMQNMVDDVLKRALQAAKIAESAGRGVVGGAVGTVPGQRQRQ